MTIPVNKSRRQLNLQRFALQQIHQRRRLNRRPSHQLSGRLSQFASRLDLVRVRIRILHQRRRHSHLAQKFASRALRQFRRNLANRPHQRFQRFFIRVVRRRSRRPFQQRPQFAHLPMRLRQQMPDLRFQRPRVHDLAERCVRRQRQQVARNVERARAQRSLVSVRLHLRRPRRNARQILKCPLRNVFVRGKKKFNRLRIERPRRRALRAKIRRVVAALFKVLIARRSLLPIPPLLVNQHHGGQQA